MTKQKTDLAARTRVTPEADGGFAPHDYAGDGPPLAGPPELPGKERHGADRGGARKGSGPLFRDGERPKS